MNSDGLEWIHSLLYIYKAVFVSSYTGLHTVLSTFDSLAHLVFIKSLCIDTVYISKRGNSGLE